MKKMLLIFAMFSLNAHAFKWSELTKEEKEKVLNKKELVVKVEEIPGSTWPKVTVFGESDATPLETFAFFTAYEGQKDVVPGMKRSEPLKHVSPTDVQVAYEMHMPWPVPNSVYINGTKIFKENDQAFRAEWYQVSSNQTDDTKGECIISLDQNKTIFQYTNFIKPKLGLAKMFKSQMITDTTESVKAIIAHTEKIKKENYAKLSGYVSRVNDAFSGKYPYNSVISTQTK